MKDKQDPIYLFIHLAKTGGTTFVGHLYKHLEFDKEYIDLGPHGNPYREENNLLPIEERSSTELEKVKVIGGHLTKWQTKNIFSTREHRFITFIREPISRIISHYTFDTSREHKEQPFSKWYGTWAKDQMFLFLCDHLDSNSPTEVLDKLKYFWHIGLTEKLDPSLQFIFAELGIDNNYKNRRVSGEKENSTKDLGYSDPDKVVKEKYIPTSEELEMIKMDNQLDIWLYNHIKENLFKNKYNPTSINVPKKFRDYKLYKDK